MSPERSVTHVSGTDSGYVGGGGWTRTNDLRIMRPSLEPPELHRHGTPIHLIIQCSAPCVAGYSRRLHAVSPEAPCANIPKLAGKGSGVVIEDAELLSSCESSLLPVTMGRFATVS